MANATERKQVGLAGATSPTDTSTKITSLASVVARATPALPARTELHGKIAELTHKGTGFDNTTAV